MSDWNVFDAKEGKSRDSSCYSLTDSWYKRKKKVKERKKVRAFEILADSIGEWDYFGRFLSLWKGVWRRVRTIPVSRKKTRGGG